jgi:hypothetical protein
MRGDGSGIEELFVTLIAGMMGLVLIALWLLIAYGVVIMIVRHAFGIELPNPFELLPIEWRQKFPYLMPQGSHYRGVSSWWNWIRMCASSSGG